MTHFQAATTKGSRDRRFSLRPTVVLNAFLWNKWPADDAAGGNSTWLGNKMRVIGDAGKSGRHVWPLVNMGCGGGGLVQPFSQKSRTPTVAKEFQIRLYGPAEADLELFCNSWSAGFLGERL